MPNVQIAAASAALTGDGDTAGYVTVEIYDQLYHLSGHDSGHIRELARQVDTKMRAVAAAGHTADSLRVAVLAALKAMQADGSYAKLFGRYGVVPVEALAVAGPTG